MMLREIQQIYRKELKEIYTPEEIDHLFYRLIEHFCDLPRFILAIEPQYVLSKANEQPIFEALAALRNEKPLQYITGLAYFMDLELSVNESVLIPRPETEELVTWILKEHSHDEETLPSVVLDIGTGSGCIALALKKAWPGARIIGLDRSEKAIQLARENAIKNHLQPEWEIADIFTWSLQQESLDIIVSNPPYVRSSERSQMRSNVLNFEPEEALFVPDEDPLIYYRRIGELGKTALRNGGALYFEINEALNAELISLLEVQGYSRIESKKDIFGKNRFLRAFQIRQAT